MIAATQLWLERAVIGLNLCPFAKAVHVKQQIRYAVTGARTADELLAELEHELQTLAAADPETLDTTLLIHSAVTGDFLDYHFFLAEADAAIRSLELDGVIQIPSLHPNYEFAGCDADDIDNYTNRAPYPTLHLLREVSIDRAVAAFPDAADIFERNIETLRRPGHEGWRRLWMDDAAKVKSPMAAFENRPFFGVDRNSASYQPICSPCRSLINARHTTELTFNPSGDRATHFHSSLGKTGHQKPVVESLESCRTMPLSLLSFCRV